MMATQEHAIAVGHNNAAGLFNVQDFIRDRGGVLIRFNLQSDPVPPGATETRTLDKKQHWDGTQFVEWRYTVVPLAGLNALIVRILGSIDTDNGSVTLRTRKRDNTFANYNAEMDIPNGYRIRKGADGVQYALDVVFRFAIVAAL
jgi:hypothetical protein